MLTKTALAARRLRSALGSRLIGHQVIVAVPALTLVAYWIGGEAGLILMALAVPSVFLLAGILGWALPPGAGRDGLTGLAPRADAVAALDLALPLAVPRGRAVGSMAVAVDSFADSLRDLDGDGRLKVVMAVADRLRGALRDCDVVARLEDARFAIALPDLRRADQASMIAIGTRLQAAVAEPISVDGQRVFVTLSVGLCLPGKLTAPSGESLIAAAEAALAAATAAGGGALRAYDPRMRPLPPVDHAGATDLARALDSGEIQPWFQPLVTADTGRLVGFEALARWSDPRRGLVLPSEFLSRIEAGGLSRRLGEVMLYATLQALRSWDRAGLEVPSVSVNFGHAELSAPDLADRVRWDLDRFDIDPGRLTIEVSEQALAGDTAPVELNLRALARLGCRIDLDDFGTGNTSIASLKRFSVNRLKIDRSFVTRVDRDGAQADMVLAILTMAKGMQLGTVAEGVETVAEQTVLAAMGCEIVQGFAIARPMAQEDVATWIAGRQRKLAAHGHAPGVTVLPKPVTSGKTA